MGGSARPVGGGGGVRPLRGPVFPLLLRHHDEQDGLPAGPVGQSRKLIQIHLAGGQQPLSHVSLGLL